MTLYSGLMLFLALSSAYKGRGKIKFVFSSVVLMCLMGFKDLTVGNDTQIILSSLVDYKNYHP